MMDEKPPNRANIQGREKFNQNTASGLDIAIWSECSTLEHNLGILHRIFQRLSVDLLLSVKHLVKLTFQCTFCPFLRK